MPHLIEGPILNVMALYNVNVLNVQPGQALIYALGDPLRTEVKDVLAIPPNLGREHILVPGNVLQRLPEVGLS